MLTSGVAAANSFGSMSGLTERQFMWLVTAHHSMSQRWKEAGVSALDARPDSYFDPLTELNQR